MKYALFLYARSYYASLVQFPTMINYSTHQGILFKVSLLTSNGKHGPTSSLDQFA
jgi:hypothetical protein